MFIKYVASYDIRTPQVIQRQIIKSWHVLKLIPEQAARRELAAAASRGLDVSPDERVGKVADMP